MWRTEASVSLAHCPGGQEEEAGAGGGGFAVWEEALVPRAGHLKSPGA